MASHAMFRIAVISLCCLPSPMSLAAALISGTITDANGRPIPGIKVDVEEKTSNGSFIKLGQVITGPTGAYFLSSVRPGRSARITVFWEFPLGTPVFSARRSIIFRGVKNIPGNDSSTPVSVVRYQKKSAEGNYMSGAAIINMAMDKSFPANYSKIISHVQQFLVMAASERGASGWKVNYDIDAWAIAPRVGCFYLPSEGSINISDNLPFQSAIYHEMGHFIHDKMYSVDWIGGGHSMDTVLGIAPNPLLTSDKAEKLSFQEGWGDLWGGLAFDYYPTIDTFMWNTLESNTLTPYVWRGQNIIQTPTNDGTDNNGELIENNIASIMYSGGPYRISDFFRIFANSKPNTFRELYWGALDMRPQSEATRDAWMTHVERHGIVYARAKFRDNNAPFVEAGPGMDEAVGNAVLLRNTWHVRGVVHAGLIAMRKEELHAQSADNLARARLLYKVAVANAGESAQPANKWKTSSQAGSVPTGSNHLHREPWDTSRITDDKYDVAAQARSVMNLIHWDSLFPDFTGDANAVGDNTDEKWLKRIGAWYSRGFVTTDNTVFCLSWNWTLTTFPQGSSPVA